MAKLSVERCREILGHAADGMTNEQIEAERDNLERVADSLYGQLQTEIAAHGTERVESELSLPGFDGKPADALERFRWMAHATLTGEHE